MFVRVKDPSTGHEIDLPEEHPWITSGDLVLLGSDRWPPSPVCRPPLYHTPRKAAARRPSAETPPGAPTIPDTTEKE